MFPSGTATDITIVESSMDWQDSPSYSLDLYVGDLDGINFLDPTRWSDVLLAVFAKAVFNVGW